MNKNIKILIGIATLLIVIMVGVFIFINKPVQIAYSPVSELNVKSYVTLVIDNGNGNPKILDVELSQGKTAFDALKNGAESSGISIKTQNYDIGVFVQAVGGVENGKDGKYWLYYINGEMSQVSADKKEVKSGDKIEFKFEKSTF